MKTATRVKHFTLRLQPSLMEEARKVAKAEVINVAVAEKVSALRTDEYLAERAARGDLKKALQLLERAAKGNPLVPGDGVPVKRARRRRWQIDLMARRAARTRHVLAIFAKRCILT